MKIRNALLLAAALPASFVCSAVSVRAAEAIKLEAQSRHPNVRGQLDQPLRYRPDGADFVIDNGAEFFNRPLYGGNSAFRVDAGDKPEFSLYLPGRGGNLRLGLCSAGACTWLHEAASITTRYRPGEMHYDVSDARWGAAARIKLVALAYAATEGLALEVRGTGLPHDAQLVAAFGAGDGKRGRRDGDIGTEAVPISQYFQFVPAYARGVRLEAADHGFRAVAAHATISATFSAMVNAAMQGDADAVPAARAAAATVTKAATATFTRHDAAQWAQLDALLAAGSAAGSAAESAAVAENSADVAVLRLPLSAQPLHLALQVTARARASEQAVYRAVGAGSGDDRAAAQLLPAFAPAELAPRFAEAQQHFAALRQRVSIDTPDPYLNAAMGALNVAADAVWDGDQRAIMHGAVAWRTKLLGWRGPYALDALGWHERARSNFDAWTGRQNTSPIPAQLPGPDVATNLARNEAALHSNGDLSNSHYDMNIGFIDALLRHLLWNGDRAYAAAVWPVIERHLAWERRLFRREFGPHKLPLYDAYAAIWASDDLYYNGGGVTHTSAYNFWHNTMAARLAAMLGKDATPYLDEAAAIRRAMREQLWMPERGAFAEFRDALGEQLLHPSYALWSFYHTIDAQAASPFEAARMAAALDSDRRAIPVQGPGVPNDRPYRVLPTTHWMPYSWSINNVVMGENLHTALAYWQAGRSETAFELTKGALLASLYMGISPGNIGTMNYLDVYRREAQRDFADGAGVMARTLVEGLFGVRPDALAGVLTVRPGLPGAWQHARLSHPDVTLAYRRHGQRERWHVQQSGKRFARLLLELPVRAADVASVRVNGKPVRWRSVADAVGAPRLAIETAFAQSAEIDIRWRGAAIVANAAKVAPGARAVGAVSAEGFQQWRQGSFSWWQLAAVPAAAPAIPAAAQCTVQGPDWTSGSRVQGRHVDLSGVFNDRVTALFQPGKYLAPRSPYATLALPSQGAGAWAGHVQELPAIDDSGVRAAGGVLALSNGLSFATPAQAEAANIAFTSQWTNYPRSVTTPLRGQAARAFLLMAGTTNYMQSDVDNGDITVQYADGSRTRVALRNPDNWWPIEQDYFFDDYQFPFCGTLPVRVDLKTGQVHVPDASHYHGNGRRIDGGAATVLSIPLDPTRPLQSLTVRTLANDVVIGLMAVTLDGGR